MSSGVIRCIKELRAEANRLLNDRIEEEMRRVISHRSIGTVLKCMGEVTVYDRDGNPFDPTGQFNDKPPGFCGQLFELAELDVEYYSLTGNPLKLFKDADGNIHETKEW